MFLFSPLECTSPTPSYVNGILAHQEARWKSREYFRRSSLSYHQRPRELFQLRCYHCFCQVILSRQIAVCAPHHLEKVQRHFRSTFCHNLYGANQQKSWEIMLYRLKLNNCQPWRGSVNTSGDQIPSQPCEALPTQRQRLGSQLP